LGRDEVVICTGGIGGGRFTGVEIVMNSLVLKAFPHASVMPAKIAKLPAWVGVPANGLPVTAVAFSPGGGMRVKETVKGLVPPVKNGCE
jgi:hypothetical protein